MKKIKQIIGGSISALALVALMQIGPVHSTQSTSSDSALNHSKSGIVDNVTTAKKGSFDIDLVDGSQTIARKGSFDLDPVDGGQVVARKGSFDITEIDGAQVVARKGSFDLDPVDGAQVVARKGSFDETINLV